MVEIMVKTCMKCKNGKLITEFYKDKSRKDGFQNYCKTCKTAQNKKYYQDNIAKRLTNNEKYYAKNRNQILIQQKEYNQLTQNKLHKAIYDKEYNSLNKEKITIERRKYRRLHKIEIVAAKKRYYKSANGEASKSKGHCKRRALKQEAPCEDFKPIEVFKRDRYICQRCGAKTRPDYKNPNHSLYPNLDHIVPLSKGGMHSMQNTQCLCHLCNTRKWNTGVGDQLRLFG